jgi:drug/metabolite transporter (DMT)-like permease
MATATDGETILLRHRAEILVAGVAFSLGGLLIRQIEVADAWQILFYRSGFLALGLALYIAWRTQGAVLDNLRQAGPAGILGGLCLGISMIAFVWAVTHTTVANTLFILAASPFVAAALGWLLIGERVRARTWSTMLLAGLGIGVMVADGLVLGHVAGQLAAVICTLGIGGLNVTLRWRRHIDMTSTVLYAAMFSGLVGGLVAAPSGFAVPLADVGWCLAYGGPIMILGLALYTHGGRFVPAAEVALLSLSEVALGPVWVWLALDERPSQLSLAGGAVVLAAVVTQILLGGRPRRLPAPLD